MDSSLDFLFQGVYLPPLFDLPVETEGVFRAAAVSVCLPVAGCCTDTSTGARYKLYPVALVTMSHWVEASCVSVIGSVWVPAFPVLLDVFMHWHTPQRWAAVSAVLRSTCCQVSSWKGIFSISFWSCMRLKVGFMGGDTGLGWRCLCFGFSCWSLLGFRVSAQWHWSI